VKGKGTYLNDRLLSMHLQVSGGKEKERNTYARLTRWVRQWARAHDVRVNDSLKSGLKPRRSVTSFCCLFFYEFISNTF
jgi:hypothetical protein